MNTTIHKRGVSLLLAVVMCLASFLGIGTTTAYAAEETDEVCLVSFPRDGDANYGGEWGHDSQEFMNGWSAQKSRYTSVYAMGSYEGNICYCIEPGVPLKTGDRFTKKGENFWDNYPSSYNNTISPDDIKLFIGRIFQYGYTGTISTAWRSQNEGGDKLSHAVATQLLIWETVVGERDEDFNKVSTGGKDAICDQISTAHPLYSQIMSYYASIARSVQNHSKIPSFLSKSTGKAQNIEMEWDGEKYTATLTDTNNVLGGYSFSANDSGIRFSANGNRLSITADTAPKSTVTITAEKKNSQRRGVITWTDGIYGPNGELQDTVTYAQSVNDPVKGYLKIKVSYGSAKIIKTSEDGKVDGVSFRVQGGGMDTVVKTANGGQLQLDNLRPDVYTVTELTEEKYEPQEVRRVTVVSGQTATVTFSNVLKRGDLTVTKTAEDGLAEGAKFHLYGTSLSGLAVDEYAVVGSDGRAYFKDVLIGTGYTLEEVDTAIRYVVPEKQTAAIEWNKVTNKAFDNILKKWQLTVTKSDSETGTPQGDASLAGAVYGIYKGDQLVDTYTTDSNGQFTTEFYICDSDWSLRELSASTGYLVTSGSEHIGAEPKLYTVEYNHTALDVLETVQKGKIAIIKHCDDGETQIETPEAGAEFEVYLKSSGSYEAAKDSERDILVCDEFGFAETKLLPYGIYRVVQTRGWDGKELMPAFDVFVNKDGETYRYLINNATFEALIEIVKKDIETGKVIPASGIGFKVRNTDTGEYIVQHINYPTPVDIEIYYTDSTGKLMMPEALPYGNYEIIEQNTCYGYVLDSSPVPFTVDGNQTVVTVEKHNIAQKGTITVTKTGEAFASVQETDGLYQPVYRPAGLAGAVYEVTAAEDVITPDGTLRYAKGDVVAKITTGADGTAATAPLYLGKFEVREKTAPFGMVISDEVHSVELTYAGQEVAITETATSFYNERQKAEISLSKVLEKNESFGIGNNSEILSVQFGLFAAEDLTAADGSVIPTDGLLEIVNCDENGKAAFAADIPVGAKLYIQEIATDSHYILSDEKYPVVFEYAGQEIACVEIKVNDGEAIANEIIYGTVKGLKIDRETGETIEGAAFGLFRADETEFTAEKAILTAESGKDGVFTFENLPFGNWLVKELQPAEGFLPNEELYPVTVTENEETIEITVVNDRIPEIGTTATVDGEKEICATEVFTLTDTVSYQHLIPGKEYLLKGVLMDKATGKPLLIDGKEIRSSFTFKPDAPDGEITVTFVFDASGLTTATEIVVFESLYRDGVEIAAHADIEDEGQTVKLTPPTPDIPQTGDNSNLGFWIGLGGIALGGLISCAIIYFKKKKDDDGE